MKFVENEAPSQGPTSYFRLVQADFPGQWAYILLMEKCFTPEQLPKIVISAKAGMTKWAFG
jgi:hypothetical protein